MFLCKNYHNLGPLDRETWQQTYYWHLLQFCQKYFWRWYYLWSLEIFAKCRGFRFSPSYCHNYEEKRRDKNTVYNGLSSFQERIFLHYSDEGNSKTTSLPVSFLYTAENVSICKRKHSHENMKPWYSLTNEATLNYILNHCQNHIRLRT